MWKLFLSFLPFLVGVSALNCWKCEYSKSNAECNLKGGLQKCQDNENACQIHVRSSSSGLRIRKECKAADACQNNQIQNNRRAFSPVQCNLNNANQVCRCCCSTSGCNKHLYDGQCFSQLFPRKIFQCNGNALNFDMVAVVDSSSSLRLSGWGLEIDLLSQILWHFKVGQNGVRVGAFHYNNRVYTDSAFHMDQVESNKDLTNRMLSWRYEGVGTLTGQALKYARYNMFSAERGNRVGVRDFLILITDGVSQDDYANVTAELTNEDVTLIVIGVGLRPGSQAALEVASIGHHFIAVESNHRNLRLVAQRVARRIANEVCPGGPWYPPAGPPLWKNRCIRGARNPINGRVSCSNGREKGSTCTFSCNRGFRVRGSRKSTCKTNRHWTKPHPVCRPDNRRCSALVAPVDGSMSCTKSTHNRAWSDCHFTCNAPSFIAGQPKLECRPFGFGDNDVAWDFNEPLCVSVQCPVMTQIRHGVTTCTAENNPGSVCEHVCKAGFTHYPPRKNVTECTLSADKKSARFIPNKPCCINETRLLTELCPPLPDLDIVVVVDSSSSVKLPNWEPQMNFVKKVVSVFDVGINKTRIGVFRYNKLIDNTTEIKLGDAGNLTTLLTSIDAIPYDGSGTLTGQAINYTFTHHLSEEYGNRPDVEDFVIVITDGKSQDDVIVPSQQLRDNGAMVFAVGVGLKENGLQTMNDIAGNPSNAFNVEGGFGALNDTVIDIQDLLKQVVCSPCKRLREPVVEIPDETEETSEETASEETKTDETATDESESEETESSETPPEDTETAPNEDNSDVTPPEPSP